MSPQRAVLAAIVLGTAVRLVLAATTGLGVDESYAVSVARTFSLSYFDHPPLHFWLIWLTARLANSESAFVLRMPFILLFAGTTWMMYRLGAALFGQRAGMHAAILLNVSPVFSLSTGTWLLPDGPLMFFLLATVLRLVCIFHTPGARPSLGQWLLAGAMAGMALLSKYHGVFLLFGCFLYLLTTAERRKLLLSARPYLALLVAGLLFSPVLIWNYHHDYISFLFQGSRGAAGAAHPSAILISLAGQAVWLFPWIWLPLLGVFLMLLARGPGHPRRDPGKDRRWFLWCFAVGPIAIFTAAAAWGGPVLMFHWQAPGYLFLFPVLGDGVARLLPAGSGRNRLVTGWLKASVIVYPAILAIAASHTATGWLRGPFPGLFTAGDPSLDALDWTDLGLFLTEKELAGPPVKFVVARDWIEAAKIDYGLGGRLPVLCLSKAPHHFAFMHAPGEFKGQDGLIIVRQKSASKALKAYAPYFAALEPAGTAKIKRRIYGEEDLAVFRGRSFSGTYPLPYGLGVAGKVNWREHNAPD